MKKKYRLWIVAGILYLPFLPACHPEPDNQAPVAGFSVRPMEGNTETIFKFDASETTDDMDSIGSLRFRWDWESDGRWDTEWVNDPVANHRFTKSGVFQIEMEVADSDGATASHFEFVAVSDLFFTDLRDNQLYKAAIIGNQVWMAENLKYDVMNDCWCFNDDPENCEKFGRLYTWESARQACPSGWRLPDKSDWDELLSFIGENPGYKLRSKTGWNAGNNGSDLYGFDAKPAGFRHYYDSFSGTSSYAYFWSNESHSADMAYNYLLFYNRDDVERNYLNKQNGFSVRCLRY